MERELLQKLVWCEARGEDITGQALVATVVLNRVRHKSFPDNVYDVVFQKRQFEPVATGAINKARPGLVQEQAVERALSGTVTNQEALYFCTQAVAGKWHERNLVKLFRHGGHVFYGERSSVN